jgi:hypothetical protein
MADELTPNEFMAYLSGLTTGAIRGIIDNGEQMRKGDPDRMPVVDDGILFQVAAVLAAAVIDANPGYADESKFEEAADQIREHTLEFLKTVRTMSGMGNQPLLHHMFKVAGVKPVMHPSNLQKPANLN